MSAEAWVEGQRTRISRTTLRFHVLRAQLSPPCVVPAGLRMLSGRRSRELSSGGWAETPAPRPSLHSARQPPNSREQQDQLPSLTLSSCPQRALAPVGPMLWEVNP